MNDKRHLTDEEVEIQIAMLKKDPDVRLARAENREKYKRRQQLYGLRNLKKRGEQLRNDPEFAWLVEAVEGGENDDV